MRNDDDSNDQEYIFWPQDLLTQEKWCENARVLVCGYNSKVIEGYSGANKSNLFAQSRSLLCELEREKPSRRPVIFVAHSLGGLIVKEVSDPYIMIALRWAQV